MSARTGDPALIRELNNYLGQELGRNEYGDSYFSWRWSEDMYWPARATGKILIEPHEVLVPILGTDEVEKTVEERRVPEYVRDRQVRNVDTWYLAKWLTPWELTTGPRSGHIRHGDQYSHPDMPSRIEQLQAWARLYPGMDFPAQGWRIPTDAYLPRSPQGERAPNWPDTRAAVTQIKFQASQRFDPVLAAMMDELDRMDLAKEKPIMDEIRDSFPSFLNPVPGKRSNFVSMPWSKIDRLR